MEHEIELVVIGTPNTTHFSIAKACLEANKHVVIEKPFTTNLNDAAELISISKNNDSKIFVYHNRRYDGDFLSIQKLIQQRLLGNIVEYEAHFDRFAPHLKENAWRDEPDPGSGILFDLGSHLIDQALVLFGDPESVFADVQSQRKGSRVDDYFDLTLFYPKLRVKLKAGMMVKEIGPRYQIHGDKGSFVKFGIDPQEALLKDGIMPEGENWGMEDASFHGILNVDNGERDYIEKFETLNGNYHLFYNNVYEVLRECKEMEITAVEAYKVIKIIEKAFESNLKKRIINFT